MKIFKVNNPVFGWGTAGKALSFSFFISILLSPISVSAIGFTGPFDPQDANWNAFFTIDNIPYTPVPDTCGVTTGGCIEVPSATEAAVGAQLISDPNIDGPVTTTWTWTNTTNSNYYISFDFNVADIASSSGYAQIKVNGASILPNNASQWLASSGDGSITSTRVAPNGGTLSFVVTAPLNSNTDVFLNISNFNAQVPGPLPAAGAATAFGYSRRLRRRVKGRVADGCCPPLQPAHPAAYLNLAPAALKSMPVSFNYTRGSVETDRSHQAA